MVSEGIDRVPQPSLRTTRVSVVLFLVSHKLRELESEVPIPQTEVLLRPEKIGLFGRQQTYIEICTLSVRFVILLAPPVLLLL